MRVCEYFSIIIWFVKKIIMHVSFEVFDYRGKQDSPEAMVMGTSVNLR